MTREEAIDMLYGMKADNLNLDDAYTKDKYDALEMAIKALEELPKRRKEAKRWRTKAHQMQCEDAISRQAVNTLIDELARAISDERCCISRGRSTATIMQDILDLPPVKQEPRWIPVSERLPEPCTFVNVTCHSLIDDREDWVVETLYLPIPKNHNPMHYSDWGNIPMLNDGDCEVIAWVERIIPEPYKAERGRNEIY